MLTSDTTQTLLDHLRREKQEAEQNLTLFGRGEMRLLHYEENVSERYMLMLRKRISEVDQLLMRIKL